MSSMTAIGTPPWTRKDIVQSIPEFEQLYDLRPIKDNQGGMKAPHMFATWFMVRWLSPEWVIESGVWKGQSTWLLEQACPNARIISIDPKLASRGYVSPHATYFRYDLSEIELPNVNPESTVLFFDDHQDAYKRLQLCKWLGFRDVIFEDNYPQSQGDCYSLKKALEAHGSGPTNDPNGEDRSGRESFCHAQLLRRHLEVYHEFPPVFKREKTRWNDEWDPTIYPTPVPIFGNELKDQHKIFWEDATSYTWICYARLKQI